MNLKNAIAVEDRFSAKQYNERLFRDQLEKDKQREQEIEVRRAEWTATPDSEKTCTQCGLPLDGITISQITVNPMRRHEHPFCNSFELEAGVARGLADLLREAYGDEQIPLDSLRQVIEVYRSQHGVCALSHIKLTFAAPAEETQVIEARHSYQSALTALDNAILNNAREKEQQQRKRHAELHQPTFDYDKDGKLRLISRTVARWKDGLSDDEFLDLVRTLHSELTPVYPTSRSHNPVAAVGQMQMSSRRIR